MTIGQSIPRVDAYAKVTGSAQYVGDLEPHDAYFAKIVRSPVANGLVRGFDLTAAQAVPGVVLILTCFDAPDIQFPTAGHPWALDPARQDISDRKLLNTRIRVWGDEIAVVVARDRISAEQAARLVVPDIETYPALSTPEDAMKPDATCLHVETPNNIVAHTNFHLGDGSFEEAAATPGAVTVSGTYHVPAVQHCHMELVHSIAYMEGEKIVVISSTQIPHIVRRVCGQALGIPWSRIRVIKPYIGGGFGNKQDVLVEPLAAWLTTQVGGHAVKIELSREEVLGCTRTRHEFTWNVQAAAAPDGTLLARTYYGLANQGGYASHGHAIASNAANVFKQCYHDRLSLDSESFTVYTNRPTAGAMRGYGIPQGCFVMEALTDDLAYALHMDPLEFRLKNCIQAGYVDPHNGITMHSYGLDQAIAKGREAIEWDKKRAAYQNQTGSTRRGVGMALFTYKSNVHPFSLETSSCRMVLHEDGRVSVQMGATEIGQGADTVFSQMAAEAIGLPMDAIDIQTVQDTDITPFDTGAYGSRQTYVCGMACRRTGESLCAKILDYYAACMLERDAEGLTIKNGIIYNEAGASVSTVSEVAMESCYSRTRSLHITAEETYHCEQNSFATGVCFAEIEVDIPLGQIHVLHLINVHDSGKIINPQLAEAQCHGGMSMGLGYALSEELLFDDACRPLNANLLDYKIPTAMDTPHLEVHFVEVEDPTAPYGNKALGEPPTIPVAPAIRNALLHATGVSVHSLPLTPQKLIEHFRAAGLLGGTDHV